MGSVASLDSGRRGGVRWTPDDPPEKIKQFVLWWVHERKQGEGAGDYARQSGYAEATVNVWLRDPRVLHVLDALVMSTTAGPVRVLNVLDMLYRRATQDEDVKAARTYLEAVGKMAPRRAELDVRITDTRTLSDDQLRAELQRAVALLEDRALPEGPIEEAEVVEDSLDT